MVCVDVSNSNVVVVMSRSVYIDSWIDKWVHFCACSQCVKMLQAQKLELLHQWSGMCSGWLPAKNSDDLFVCTLEW